MGKALICFNSVGLSAACGHRSDVIWSAGRGRKIPGRRANSQSILSATGLKILPHCIAQPPKWSTSGVYKIALPSAQGACWLRLGTSVFPHQLLDLAQTAAAIGTTTEGGL